MKKVAKAIVGMFGSRGVRRGAETPSTVTINPTHHDLRIKAAPMEHDGSQFQGPLSWRSSDTSVVRLDVAPDTRSAIARCMGAGRAVITITDGKLMQTHVVQVEHPQPVQVGSIKVTMEKIPKE